MTQESSVFVTNYQEDIRSKLGYELLVRHQLIGESHDINHSKEHGTDFLMDHRHLWLRSTNNSALWKSMARHLRIIRVL